LCRLLGRIVPTWYRCLDPSRGAFALARGFGILSFDAVHLNELKQATGFRWRGTAGIRSGGWWLQQEEAPEIK